MQELKKKIRKSAKPLEQVARRISEEKNLSKILNNANTDSDIQLLMKHHSGPLVNEFNTLNQFKKFKTKTYCLNISKTADRFILLKNDTIVEVKNIISNSSHIALLGFRYNKSKSFFLKPCDSSVFGINYIEKSNNEINMWQFDLFQQKLVVLPIEDKLVSFPFLHTH